MKLRDRMEALVAVPEAKSRLITVVKQREIVAFPFGVRRSCFESRSDIYVRLSLGNLSRSGIFAFDAKHLSNRKQIKGRVNNSFVIS